MSYVADIFEKLENGKPVENKMCPRCGRPLSVILYGLRDEEFDKVLTDNNVKYCLGGCMCFGDDRDPIFRCNHCRKDFNEELKYIRLISCPLEASNYITKGECGNYELLSSKEGYELLDEREMICNEICPAMNQLVTIKTKDGCEYKGILQGTWRKFVDSNPKSEIQLLQVDREKNVEDIEIEISNVKSIRYNRLFKLLHLSELLGKVIEEYMYYRQCKDVI